jgi:hypothetical protein
VPLTNGDTFVRGKKEEQKSGRTGKVMRELEDTLFWGK